MGLFDKKLKNNTQNKEEETFFDPDCSLTIKILGSGCKNCVSLADNVKEALKEMNLKANLVKVTDIAEIAAFGVMSTPAIVVNDKVVSFGKVLKPNEVIKILEKVAL